MKSSIKTAVSLLITIGIFVGVFVASSLGLFSNVENKIYEPARLNVIQKRLDSVAACNNEYISNLLLKFGSQNGGFMSKSAVSSFLLLEPSDSILRDFQFLKANVPALEGIRVVDKNGKRVHFSSFRNDFRIEGRRRIYSDYSNLKTRTLHDELDFSLINVFGENGEQEYRIIFDGNEERILFSYPLFEKESEAIVIFYVNAFEFTSELYKKNLISVNEKLTLISSADGKVGGFVFGMPSVGQEIVASEILNRWKENSIPTVQEIIVSKSVAMSSGITVLERQNFKENENLNAEKEKNSVEEVENQIQEPKSYVSLNLITSEKGDFVKISGLYSSQMLTMPSYIRILLLICAFITVSLIIVIIFSLKKDDDVVIRSRMKKIQLSLLNEYFEKDYDKKKIAALIEEQKDSLSEKIKKSLGKRSLKLGKQLDFMLEQSWQDIISIFKGKNDSGHSSFDINEIRKLFEEVISSTTLKTQAVNPVFVAENQTLKSNLESNLKKTAESEKIEEVQDVEELEDVEDLEPIEDLEEVSDLQSVEDTEEVEDLEEIDDFEEAEAIEDLEAVEELEEVSTEDEVNPSEKGNFSAEDEVSYYHYENNVRKFEGTEPLVIGDSTNSANLFVGESLGNSVGDDFFISKPFDYLKDENFIDEEEIDLENKNVHIQDEKVFELEPLPDQEEFMFTPFAANDNGITELIPEAIVLGEDGVFHISENIQPSNIPLDEEFKKLVASVIK